MSSIAPVVMPCKDSAGLVFLVRINSSKLPAWLELLISVNLSDVQ